jgi:hypothetical protein
MLRKIIDFDVRLDEEGSRERRVIEFIRVSKFKQAHYLSDPKAFESIDDSSQPPSAFLS